MSDEKWCGMGIDRGAARFTREGMSPEAVRCAQEIAAVLAKHEASIGGCGCCGSPWLELGGQTTDNVDALLDVLAFDAAKEETV